MNVYETQSFNQDALYKNLFPRVSCVIIDNNEVIAHSRHILSLCLLSRGSQVVFIYNELFSYLIS
jgi:hypothetical protein